MNPEIVIVESLEEMGEEGARRFARLAGEAVATRGRFNVALSGGQTPVGLYRRLAHEPYRSEIPWAWVHLFWGDERAVPPTDPESNFGQATSAFIEHVPIPNGNVHPVRGDLAPEAAAQEYAAELEALLPPRGAEPTPRGAEPTPRGAGPTPRGAGPTPRGAEPTPQGAEPRPAGQPWPEFDLVLLGMGDDGHVAALFPGSAALDETARPVVASSGDYRGRPAQRVTLTLPTINAARQVMVLVSGAAKAAAVRTALRVRAGGASPDTLPAQRVRPAGQMTWLLDRDAAAELWLDQ